MRKVLQDRALRKASALVRNGWTKGTYNKGDCYCAMGAINAQTGYNPGLFSGDMLGTEQLYKRLAEYLTGTKHTLGNHSCFEAIEQFNDHEATDKHAVADALWNASYA